MGTPPQVARRADLDSSTLPCSGTGWDLGKPAGPPLPPLPVPYILERHPSLAPPSPKGGHGLHFHLSPPPKWGTAAVLHQSRASGHPRCARARVGGSGASVWGRGVGTWGGSPVAMWGTSHLLNVFR